MRIIAGAHKGKALALPEGRAVRPTSDRVREMIFNVLAHGIEGFGIEGARVLDLFAGTGALGLEAISRGAAHCLFVEEAAPARALIRRNVESLNLTGVTRIWRRDATSLGEAGRTGQFDLVFADPPYRKGLAARALDGLTAGGWLSPGAVIVIEEAADVELSIGPPLSVRDRRRTGDTCVTYLAMKG